VTCGLLVGVGRQLGTLAILAVVVPVAVHRYRRVTQ
jgi:hypothetical protein